MVTCFEDVAALIGYMREEDGKVYARYIPDADVRALEKGIDVIPYAPMMAIYNHDIEALSQTDVLLFDSSLELGDELYSTEDKATSDVFVVKKIEEVECLGVERKVWTLDKVSGFDGGYNYYEGVGDIYGLLPFPSAVPITYDRNWWELVEVIDGSGNVLFAPGRIITGIDGVNDEAKVVKETYHTLNGFEVREPSAVGIYIKTIELDNGEVRTEKVFVR